MIKTSEVLFRRNSGIEQLNQVIQECPEGKDKKQLLKFSHDFYNNRGDLGKKFQKIVFLLPPDLAFRIWFLF